MESNDIPKLPASCSSKLRSRLEISSGPPARMICLDIGPKWSVLLRCAALHVSALEGRAPMQNPHERVDGSRDCPHAATASYLCKATALLAFGLQSALVQVAPNFVSHHLRFWVRSSAARCCSTWNFPDGLHSPGVKSVAGPSSFLLRGEPRIRASLSHLPCTQP